MTFIDETLPSWQAPEAIWRSAPFWSWNARLEPARLVRQIEQMHAAGFGGFFMHSRYGLKTPYLSEEWFRCVGACIEKARELGMKAYLYDEDRWPSGTAGGEVTRLHPEYRCHYLLMSDDPEPMPQAERLGVFIFQRDTQGRLLSYRSADEFTPGESDGAICRAFDVVAGPPSGWYNDGTYLDTLNAEAVSEFIHTTHQAYADRYGKDFGELIPAIFTDEPNYATTGLGVLGALNPRPLPWTAQLPREFRARRGYDLREHLPELFIPMADEAFSKVRCDYRRTITELFVEAFSGQIGRWCEKHHLASTGHVLDEPTLTSQTHAVGAAMPHYEHMQWPGIDILTDQDRELITAKQCSSVADQLGKERVLSELYGCTGWDWPLAGHKRVGDWHLATGVNFRCPHLTHYSLAGGAKRDYPASIFAHSPWWKHYRVVEDYFARLGMLLTRGKPVRDVLVVHPIDSAWGLASPTDPRAADGLNASLEQIVRTLTGEHYDWDFGDESLLAEHARCSAKAFSVGRMSYRVVIVPPCLTLRSQTVELLAKYAAAGGTVLFVGQVPGRLDAAAAPERLGELLDSASRAGEDDWLGRLEEALPRRVSVQRDGQEDRAIWTMLREVKGGDLLFLQSHDIQDDHPVEVAVEGRRPVVLWDALTGRRTRLEAEQDDRCVRFRLLLPPNGSAMLSLGLQVKDAAEPPAAMDVADVQELSGPFDIELLEPNTAPLDYCRLSIAGEEFSAPMPVLAADSAIRARYGLANRAGRHHQPWYLYGKGVVDTSPRDACRLRWEFHVTSLPRHCELAIENPQDYRILLNDQPAGPPQGFWVDEDIRTINVTGLLREGVNVLELAFAYRPDMEIEDLQLVGDFGVRRIDDNAPRQAGNFTLVEPPRQLALGSWVCQGLDFYGAAVRYRVPIARPSQGRLRLSLPGVRCTAVAVHVGDETFVLPWQPFAVDITDALTEGTSEVLVDVIGGRKNILGPLHTPWQAWTGPGEFEPTHPKWTDEYLLNDHGLMEPIRIEVLTVRD